MKRKRFMSAAFVVALIGVELGGTNAFAANQYNIEYTGGEALGASNVNIDPDLINSLTPLFHGVNVSTTVTPASYWQEGYYKNSNGCFPVYYYTTNYGAVLQSIGPAPGFSMTNGDYRIDVEILDTSAEFIGEVQPTVNGEPIAVAVRPDSHYFYVGRQIYPDETCENTDDSIKALRLADETRVFVEMRALLYKDGETPERYYNDDMYFGITDIDASQSYKILNTGNAFSRTNMFAKSAEDLQPNTDGLRNMYVANGNYIYSEFNKEEKTTVDSADLANIYTKITSNTQTDGVHFVFGFTSNAGSSIEYYAKFYKIEYNTDENGKITGITDETLKPGENASGSSYKANKSFKFSHWVADVDVVLEDGTEIKAGDPITDEQIKTVIVDRDIKFTAVFDDDKETPAVPNTGASTMEINAAQVTASVLGILALALFIRYLPRITKRKVNFD
ncbi:hypothetical protein IJH24_02135 [Candidatus Saccharibacteria bacterium]|nr:hypothetical protein [Candidatus Saccharibacteria bacterium]